MLLLAGGYDPEGKTGTDHMSLVQVRDAAGLDGLPLARTSSPTAGR